MPINRPGYCCSRFHNPPGTLLVRCMQRTRPSVPQTLALAYARGRSTTFQPPRFGPFFAAGREPSGPWERPQSGSSDTALWRNRRSLGAEIKPDPVARLDETPNQFPCRHLNPVHEWTLPSSLDPSRSTTQAAETPYPQEITAQRSLSLSRTQSVAFRELKNAQVNFDSSRSRCGPASSQPSPKPMFPASSSSLTVAGSRETIASDTTPAHSSKESDHGHRQILSRQFWFDRNSQELDTLPVHPLFSQSDKILAQFVEFRTDSRRTRAADPSGE